MNLFKNKKKQVDSRPEILVGSRHSFLFTEAYKSLRTNVLFSLTKDGCRKIAISSPLAGEGKSTVSSQLAVSFAEMGASVLLIDCDLRRGRIYRLFEIKRSPGLANVLAGFSDVTAAVTKTQVDNLFVLPSGAIPPNPAELLASPRMQALIEEFEKSFDYIILDTSPINVVSDAIPLVKIADGIVVVTRQNYTDKYDLKRCVNTLEFVGGKILGIVLNGVESKGTITDKRYGYYKGGYYIPTRREPEEK